MTGQALARWEKTTAQVVFDGAMWVVALAFATLVRYDLDVHRVDVEGLAAFIPVALAAHGLCGPALGLYRRRWPVGSFEEVAALVQCAGLVSAGLILVNALFLRLVPRSAPIVAGVTAFTLMAGGRYLWRLLEERSLRPRAEGCRRVLVFGAGEGGSQIIRAMLRTPASPFLPVAILDDDPRLSNRRLRGVPVVGTRSDMATAAATWQTDLLLIAIPSAENALVTELTESATACGLAVKVLPPVGELLGGSVDVGDIRDVQMSDLLGRHEIRTDVDSIAGYLTGRRVLVTGAGGSIGAELCRQIHRFAPAELIMLDRDESALHSVQLSIHGRALMDSPDLVLADIRDRRTLERVIAARRPEVVFHAAALKHLPLLERFPAEAVRTNVWGTLDLLEVSVAHGVERFVNISTDKASDPCSVLGYSKRITERLTSYMTAEGDTACMSVRFGNVLGSRGSVVTTFQAQIERGGPLTVTHPEVTRYFMTAEEAVELVIQAGAIGRGGEVLVLDMGQPVRIADVANILNARTGGRVEVRYTGLRIGEKLAEALLGAGEIDERPCHPLISHVPVHPLAPSAVRSLDLFGNAAELAGYLALLCQVDTTREPSDATK